MQDANADRIALEPGVSKVYWPGHEGEEMNNSFAGQSGGPVYRVIEADLSKGEALDRLELVGIVDRQIMEDLVLARPVGRVGANGQLMR